MQNRDTLVPLLNEILGTRAAAEWVKQFEGAGIPAGALLAERGRRRALVLVTVAIGVFGFVLGPTLAAGIAALLIPS